MPQTANERLLSEEVAHQIGLHKFSNGMVQRIVALLNRVDGDLFAQLTVALETMGGESFTADRLESLLTSVRTLNATAYAAVARELTTDLRQLADYEAGYQQQLFESVIPAQVIAAVPLAIVDPGQVYAAALARPFQGRLLSEWADSIETARMTRIRDAIRMGFVEGQTTGDIVRRIRGTRAKGYSDGIIEIDRRSAESVVRTAVAHTAGVTRDRFYSANGDIIKAVQWVSTLDTRTSDICRVRDGLQYTPDDSHRPIGHTVPWLGGPGRAHWCCRSSGAPITKSLRELGIDVDEVRPGTRASMDGQVPATQTYGEWLQAQSAARQDEVLGATRGALLRDGGLTVDRFANDKGQWLDLDQLRRRDAAAFKRAGL